MDLLIALTFTIALFSSILSGMAGVGGGLIMQPYWLLIGMSPSQAIANSSFMIFGISGGSLTAFRKTKYLPNNKRLVILLGIITFTASVIGAFLIPHLTVSSFKPILAILTIVALPFLLIRKRDFLPSKKLQDIGIALFTVLIIFGSITFSSTFWILIAIVLVSFFNLNILQSTVIRRIMGLIQAAVLFALLSIGGNFVWPQAVAGIIGAVIGSYIGTRFAIAKREKFARYALAIAAFVSAVALLI